MGIKSNMKGQIISKGPELDESEIKALIEVYGKSVNPTYRLSALPIN
jgi:hypothetical protein